MAWRLMWVALLTLHLGCGGPETPESVRASLVPHTELPLTVLTHHKPLQDELARVRSEKGLPQQLLERMPPAESPEDLTSAAATSFASPAEVDRLHRTLDELWPQDALEFSPAALEHARRLMTRYRPSTDEFFKRLRLADSAFRIGLDQGILEETSWLEAVRLIARIEVLEAVQVIQEGEPDKAIPPLSNLVRLVTRLEAAPSLVSHLMAVDIRRWIIGGIKGAAMNEQATRVTHQLLFELSVADRREVGAERLAWIGDRAAGMHAYEMVRAGEFLSLLSEEEYQQLMEKNEAMDHALVVRRNVDLDETFFLETIRQLIDRSGSPYFERRTWLDQTFEKLDKDRAAPRFPSVAADLLMVGITTAQERLARGQARRDAWHLALASAVEQALTEPPAVNVETGEAWEVLVEGNRIEVRGLVETDNDLIPVLVRRPE